MMFSNDLSEKQLLPGRTFLQLYYAISLALSFRLMDDASSTRDHMHFPHLCVLLDTLMPDPLGAGTTAKCWIACGLAVLRTMRLPAHARRHASYPYSFASL